METESLNKTKVKLREFVDDNQKFISVLGIFTALTAFSINLPNEVLGYLLSLPALAAMILLWVELLRTMPHSDAQEFSLTLFHMAISGIVLAVVFYLFIQYVDVWRGLLPFGLMMIILIVVPKPANSLQGRIESSRLFCLTVTRYPRLKTAFLHSLWRVHFDCFRLRRNLVSITVNAPIG